MEAIDKEQLLYSFFVANSDSEISYQRLKNLAHGINEIYGGTGEVYSALSVLMRRGLVEQSQLSKYRLSPTCLVRGENCQVGINLPSEELTRLASFSLYSDTGLGIYEPASLEIDIPIYDFDFKGILSVCGNIRSTCYDLLDNVEEMPQFIALEIYDANEKQFVAQKDFAAGANLYKVHTFSKMHFDYFFCMKSNTETFLSYRFQRHDFETLNRLKLMLSISSGASGLVYLMRTQKLLIDQYFPLPNTIERLLFLNHIFLEGSFPKGRTYILRTMEFCYLQKIFNNKIIVNYEEHI